MNAAFLSVTNSLSGRHWVARAVDERLAEALQQRFGVPDMLARCMAGRGVTLESAADYLEPTLRLLLPNPSVLQNMDKAAARLVAAIQHNESITIFGDYDVDGGTSAALLLRFLRHCGVTARLYIPDRMSEGYGPNSAAVDSIKANGSQLVICVDCGTSAHAPLAHAHSIGLELIVLDHHTAEPNLPPCVALVNPNRLDDTSGLGSLCAVGVVFLFIVAVNRALRQTGFYGDDTDGTFSSKRISLVSAPTGAAAAYAAEGLLSGNQNNSNLPTASPKKINEPDLKQWLDLVALGTVADVVPLTGLNRAFVTQGLKVLAQTRNEGLAALMQVGRATMPPDAFTVGFILGPRVNAGGRVGKSDLGARLLACDDAAEAMALAIQLDQHNAERKNIEAEVLAAATYQATQQPEAPMLVLAGEGWHAGVIGIVAARLKDLYHRPTFIIGLDGETGKGSGRSVRGFDLGALVIAARQAGLLLNGGGHAMAAGLTVARDQLPALQEFMQERVGKFMAATPLLPSLTLDGVVSGAAATAAFLEQLERLKPFGTANPEPRFAVPDCRIIRADVVGENHVRVIFTCGGTRLTGIAFRVLDQPLGAALLQAKDRQLHLAGYLRADTYNGRNGVQLQITDAAWVNI